MQRARYAEIFLAQKVITVNGAVIPAKSYTKRARK